MKTQDKRQIIMQTAEKLFTDRRIHEITLDEVAQRASVGKGTIYRYFQDKDDLFFQVATSGFDEMCALLRREVSKEGTFAEQLLDMCTSISAFFDDRREMFHMMLAEDARMPQCKGRLRERWLKHRKHLVAAVADTLQHGIDTGVVRNDILPDVLANLLLGMLRARAHDLGDYPEDQRRLDRVVELFCNGAHARETQ